MFIELIQSYDRDIRDIGKENRNTIKNEGDRKKKYLVQTKQNLVLKEYFPADIRLIICCSTHQEVSETYNNNLVLFLQGFNFGITEQIY